MKRGGGERKGSGETAVEEKSICFIEIAPKRVDGSTQHTSVEVTDPLLWQGQRQGRAEGGASTLQYFSLLLFAVRIAKATCPSDTPSTMVDKLGQHCEPVGGLTPWWARASCDGWLGLSPHTPRTTEWFVWLGFAKHIHILFGA